MEFRPVLKTAPAVLPVSVDECKAHAIVDSTHQDSVIESAIEGVVADLDGFSGVLGRAIITQTWQVEMATWTRQFVLPVPNVSSVAIYYLDSAGAEQSVPFVIWHPVASGTLVRFPDSWSDPDLFADTAAAIRVEFDCGFGVAADVPADLKSAIKQRVAQMFADREGLEDPGRFSSRILSKYRWLGV